MPALADIWLVVAMLSAVGCSAPPGEAHAVSGDGQATESSFCAAFSVIARKCVRCHSSPPVNGAPFPLDSYEAVTAPSPTKDNPDRTRVDRMLGAVESDTMPYMGSKLDPPVEALTCEEKATLMAWLRADPEPAGSDTSCKSNTPKLLSCDDGE